MTVPYSPQPIPPTAPFHNPPPATSYAIGTDSNASAIRTACCEGSNQGISPMNMLVAPHPAPPNPPRMHTMPAFVPNQTQELQNLSHSFLQALHGNVPEHPSQVQIEGVGSHLNLRSDAQPGHGQAAAESDDPVIHAHPYLSPTAMRDAGIAFRLGESAAALASDAAPLLYRTTIKCVSKPWLDMCLTSPKRLGRYKHIKAWSFRLLLHMTHEVHLIADWLGKCCCNDAVLLQQRQSCLSAECQCMCNRAANSAQTLPLLSLCSLLFPGIQFHSDAEYLSESYKDCSNMDSFLQQFLKLKYKCPISQVFVFCSSIARFHIICNAICSS